MKYALIGCGRVSANHIRAVEQNDLDLVAICDVKPERMEKIMENRDPSLKPARYTDYKKMLDEHPEIELISIATESGFHAEIAIYCMEKGKNVIVEKPMAMSLSDADRMIETAEKNKVKLCACHQNRFNKAVQKLRKAVEEGRFGRLSHGAIHVRWNRNRGYYEQAPWRGTWAEDGGALMNQCIHGIDLLRWMMGDEIVEVVGRTRQAFHDYLEAEDLGTAILTFKSGAIGIVEGTTNVYPSNLEETLYIFGEKGTVKLGGLSVTDIDVWEFEDVREEDKKFLGMKEDTANVYGNGHSLVFKDMIEAIKEDRAPYIDGYAGRRALEVILAIYKSQKTGLPVKLPMEDFASVEMAGEFGKGSLKNADK